MSQRGRSRPSSTGRSLCDRSRSFFRVILCRSSSGSPTAPVDTHDPHVSNSPLPIPRDVQSEQIQTASTSHALDPTRLKLTAATRESPATNFIPSPSPHNLSGSTASTRSHIPTIAITQDGPPGREHGTSLEATDTRVAQTPRQDALPIHSLLLPDILITLKTVSNSPGVEVRTIRFLHFLITRLCCSVFEVVPGAKDRISHIISSLELTQNSAKLEDLDANALEILERLKR